MAKEVMAFSEDDIKGMTLTTSEFDTLKFLAAHAGVEMDEAAQEEFISQRNIRIKDIVNIWELKAKAKKLCEYIDTVMKHSFNVGTAEQFPNNVTLKNTGSTSKFVDGMAAALVCDTIIRKKLATKEQIFAQITPSDVEKATGLKKERIVEMFPDVIVEEKKSPSLVIK